MNPNSSSLGVDVTFLIAGAAIIAMATPVVGALLRLRGQRLQGASTSLNATTVPSRPSSITTASVTTTDANHHA